MSLSFMSGFEFFNLSKKTTVISHGFIEVLHCFVVPEVNIQKLSLRSVSDQDIPEIYPTFAQSLWLKSDKWDKMSQWDNLSLGKNISLPTWSVTIGHLLRCPGHTPYPLKIKIKFSNV